MDETRTVRILTTCDATIREEWSADVPADWDNQRIIAAFESDDPRLILRHVSDTPDNEHNREITAIEGDNSHG